MNLLITLEIDADAEDLAWSLHRHLRQDGRGWAVESQDHTDTVRVLIPGMSALQLLAGSVLQWLTGRHPAAVRSVTLSAANGQQIVVTAQATPPVPPEPVYAPQEAAEEDDGDYADTLTPSDEQTGASFRPHHGVTPPGPVIDPDDDWHRER